MSKENIFLQIIMYILVYQFKQLYNLDFLLNTNTTTFLIISFVTIFYGKIYIYLYLLINHTLDIAQIAS